MGQRSNTSTLRRQNKTVKVLSNESKSRELLFGLKFLGFLEQLLKRKNIVTTENCLCFIGRKAYINLTLFFKMTKLMKYKKQIKKVPVLKKLKSLIYIKETLSKEFYSHIGSNYVILKFRVLNKILNKNLVRFLYTKLRRFQGLLFSRRSNFFFDFIKATSLFSENFLPVKSYLYFIGQIFQMIRKKTHGKFLLFLNVVLELLVLDLKIKTVSKKSCIRGIKFVLNGKIKGKARASSSCTQLGCVPISTISCNISFARLHVYTLYGVFGLRAWVYRV